MATGTGSGWAARCHPWLSWAGLPLRSLRSCRCCSCVCAVAGPDRLWCPLLSRPSGPICRPRCQGTTWAGSAPCGLRMQKPAPGVQLGPMGLSMGGSCPGAGPRAGGPVTSPARSSPPAATSPASSLAVAPDRPVPPAGQQVIEEQRRRLAELKQRAAAEAQCQWDALHGAPPFPAGPSGLPPLVHSILHHLPGRERGEEGEQAYDTLSLESSDSMETSASAGHSACSPDTLSRYRPPRPAPTGAPAGRRLSPLPPQCERPGRGEAGGDGADAERSSRREEPPRGVQGEADRAGAGSGIACRLPACALSPVPPCSLQSSLEGKS